MSGIAEVFLNQGYKVSGSDLQESDITKRLEELGGDIFIGHRPENINNADVVVVSSAVKPGNLEVQEAKRLRIPVIPRAEMLGELMRGKIGIAIAGTHGKTTTTSMLGSVLTHAGLDPTLVIGGKVDSLGGNAKLGQGRYVVAEADESDGSFLHLPATCAVVTNIDNDHLDHFGSLSALEDAFVDFLGKLPFYGFAAVCAEDIGVRHCLGRITKPFITYGFSGECDFSASNVVLGKLGSSFDLLRKGVGHSSPVKLGRIELNVPGNHNVLNALAAATIGTKLDVSFPAIAAALAQFKGVRRRFEIRWMSPEMSPDKRSVIVDDYGHHPTEIMATLAAAKIFWPGRIITVFQPHRYSRTLHCRDGFLTAFHNSDVVIVTDIYAAGEDPIEGVNAKSLVSMIRQLSRAQQKIIHVDDIAMAKEAVLKEFQPGDMVLCLGAGSITKLADQLVTPLRSHKNEH